jgi:hypothetical protein
MGSSVKSIDQRSRKPAGGDASEGKCEESSASASKDVPNPVKAKPTAGGV